VPSQATVFHLEVGSKLRHSKSESEVGLSPSGTGLKNGSHYPHALYLPDWRKLVPLYA